jgi:hypothetical protein
MVITEAFMQQGCSPKGGWSRKQLAAIGVSWPPPKGWKKKLIGTRITDEDANIFLGKSKAQPAVKPVVGRINLNCPYSEKEDAKALGARWDSIRRTWYIEATESTDLTPFSRWMFGAKEIHPEDTPRGRPMLRHYEPTRFTGKYEPICQCDALPWEDCSHTPAYMAKRALQAPVGLFI